MLARATLLVHQGLDMHLCFNLQATVITARMVGQNQFSHQVGFLGVKRLAHRQLLTFWPGPLSRRAITPGLSLVIEVRHIAEDAGGKEILPDKTYAAFYPSLLIAASDGHGPWFESVVGGEGQVVRVEADGITGTLQHRAFKVIAQDDPGNPFPGLKCQDMAVLKVVHVGVQAEVQEDAPGIRQHHHEGHQGPAGLANHKVSEVSPVNLRLFARQGAKPQIGLVQSNSPIRCGPPKKKTPPAFARRGFLF